MTEISGDWTDTDHTDENAIPVSFRKVENKRVIWVEGASYRLATLSGHFELAEQDNNNPISLNNGENRIPVVITWKNTTLKRDFPLLIVSDRHYELIESFNGYVVDNVE